MPGDQGAHQHARAPGSPATSRCPDATWCSCPPSSTWAFAPDLVGQGAAASARDRRPDASAGAPASSCARWPRTCPTGKLKADMDFLIKLWNNVVQRTQKRGAARAAHLQRSGSAAANRARHVHARRGQADHRRARRVRAHQEVRHGIHARLRRADRAAHQRRAHLRRLRHRDRNRSRHSSARCGSSRAATSSSTRSRR